MVIGIKDALKFIGISVVVCCAAFVCTLFLNYNLDMKSLSNIPDAAIPLYTAQLSMGKAVAAISGCGLALTSAVLLLFYLKNYIDAHGKQLGILKAMGYSRFSVAKHFWIFGLSVLTGAAIGFVAAYLYMPTFYRVQNADGILPELAMRFHFELLLYLVVLPTLVFAGLAVFYAFYKLKAPVLNLLRESREKVAKTHKEKDGSFLKGLSLATLKSKKLLVFLIAFSAFCFSSMVQMSISMSDLSSETFAWMILSIGLILAFMTLFMSLSSVVKGNAKTIAMMRIFGYEDRVCSDRILGAYRPFSYVGFVVGTVYQFALLKIMLGIFFSDVEVPAYTFDWKALLITMFSFIALYEFTLFLYTQKIKKLSLKSVMEE